eukprot:GHVS01061909.1.p1 GENE.GHVS01061909.1~~GHVS01061909.1.p1  ORF type:complete len:102 (+),score=25.67 GHVS01061909.1:119-424(+)
MWLSVLLLFVFAIQSKLLRCVVVVEVLLLDPASGDGGASGVSGCQAGRSRRCCCLGLKWVVNRLKCLFGEPRFAEFIRRGCPPSVCGRGGGAVSPCCCGCC